MADFRASTLVGVERRPAPGSDDAPATTTREGDETAARPAPEARRDTRLWQELAARAIVSAVALLFNELFTVDPESASVIRLTTLLALGLNGPYVLAVRTRRALRAQAYLRTFVDVVLTTAGLYGAGGLAAAPYLVIYAVVPVYTAIVFSSLACVLTVLLSTVAYLSVAMLQQAGVLPVLVPPPAGAWTIAAFNLVVVNIIGWMAAVLAHAYRTSRNRLAGLYAELERAHDQSVQMNRHLQLATRRYVLGEVVTGITHEVRDSLQGVFGHLWLARRGGPPLPDAALDHLAQAEQACENAMRIMSTTLDLARRPEPERAAIAVAEIVRRVVELKTVEFRRERITLRVDLHTPLPPVLGGALQLQQALLNLVVNAQEELRASRGRREITILGWADGDRVVLDVRDTGRGIPASVLPHLFEPFHSTKAGGTGIGLAMSAGIAESLGGTLTGENHPEGGAAFRLRLPAATLRPGASAAAGG